MTAAEVTSAVRRHFGAEKDGYGPEWAALDELKLGAGAGNARADLFLVRAWAGRPRGHERILIEVKVSRSDLLHELGAPHKRLAFSTWAHRMYFAAPAGLVRADDDLGEGVGLLEVSPKGRVTVVRKAARDATPADVPHVVFVEAFRRASRAEARVRTAGTGEEDPAARIVALEGQLAVAQRAEQTAREAARRDARRLRDWMSRLAAHGGVPCLCGQPLKVNREPNYLNAHPAGVECTARYPAPDTHALAVRLGLFPDDTLPA